MTDITEILEFIKEEIGTKKVGADSDIEKDLGCYGDDFHELIEKYSNRYKVDMTAYLGYFHTGEEGFGSIGGIFFKPPSCHVQRIPVSPLMLLDFVEIGKWNIKYPEHKIPNKRYDILIDQIILVMAVIGGICFWLLK